MYFLSPNVFTLQPKGQLSKPPVATAERSKFIKRKAGWLFVEGSEPTAKEAPAADNPLQVLLRSGSRAALYKKLDQCIEAGDMDGAAAVKKRIDEL